MSDPSKKELLIKISPSIVIFTFIFAASIWLATQIKDIIFMTFVAYIISVGLNKGIDKLEKLKLPRVLGVIIVYLVFLLFISMFLAFVFPPLIKELSNLLISLELPAVFQSELQNFEINFNSVKGLLDTFGTSVGTAVGIISSTFSGAFIAITTMVISLYFSLGRPKLIEGITSLVKKNRVDEVEDFVKEINTQLGNWIRGEIILMLVIGVMTFIGLISFKIPYALPLAIIAGTLEIVPNIGPILSAVPAIIVAFIAMGWPAAAGVAILYIVIQQLENNLIVPKVMRSSVDVNPLVSILGILIGAKVFGVIGALLAVPIFIVARTVYGSWIKHLRD